VRLTGKTRRFFILIAALLLTGLYSRYPHLIHSIPGGNDVHRTHSITAAYRGEKRHVQVTGEGVVLRILADDVQGIRHQKFILQLPSGLSLLVTHNIDLAPRIRDLHKGDRVSFAGEYIWNDKGGILHWTHKDPHGRHADGWLRHKGRIYQ